MATSEPCRGCFYYRKVCTSGPRCCHYLLIEDKKRPCDPGEGCTVKITMKNVRCRRAKNGGA